VGCFRIADCTDVLTALGLPKSGKKDNLVQRILAVFRDAANL
jgi:hypothetical protein